jgi:HSP20 family protein
MLTRWAPYEPIKTFDRFNRVMEDFFGAKEVTGTFMPAVDVSETDKMIVLHAELPGINEENVEVELIGDRLTIKGRREFHREEKNENYLNIERSYGTFQRTFTLDVPVQADVISAEFKDGVLTITVPKSSEVAKKRVPVKKR